MVVSPITVLTAASGRATFESRLRAAGAVTPERAVAMLPEGSAETSGLDEAIGLGRVVRTGSGKLFLNPATTGGANGEMAMAVLLFLLVTASVLASIIALVASIKD